MLSSGQLAAEVESLEAAAKDVEGQGTSRLLAQHKLQFAKLAKSRDESIEVNVVRRLEMERAEHEAQQESLCL